MPSRRCGSSTLILHARTKWSMCASSAIASNKQWREKQYFGNFSCSDLRMFTQYVLICWRAQSLGHPQYLQPAVYKRERRRCDDETVNMTPSFKFRFHSVYKHTLRHLQIPAFHCVPKLGRRDERFVDGGNKNHQKNEGTDKQTTTTTTTATTTTTTTTTKWLRNDTRTQFYKYYNKQALYITLLMATLFVMKLLNPVLIIIG